MKMLNKEMTQKEAGNVLLVYQCFVWLNGG